MHFIWSFSVAVIVVLCSHFHGINSEQFDVWGDLHRTPLVLGISKTRYAFPFMKRTMEIKFPDEIDKGNEFGIVRGIKHSSRLDDECQPEATLVNGGINERMATIEISSQRGCGLDSLVEFFIEQL